MSEDDRRWLADLVPGSGSATPGQLRAAFTGLGRRAGRELLGPQAAALAAQGITGAARWDRATLGRVALLIAWLPTQPQDRQVDAVRELYLRGDYREQVAVLASLACLPDPARFVPLAAEASRTNVTDVFAAIACENAFPALHLPDLNFNQLVLKALFVGLDTHRIVGLPARVTARLHRMVGDFADERRAAGRSVPADIAYIQSLNEGSER
ncbi:MAG: EboA domain-containing protein [Proteobacteria bacterium]|nr:EboA domain-containing protein [Pseudomonadota bacterium]